MALNGTYENKKTRRLARSLQMPPWAALGMMEAIWAWARKAARTGRIDASQWEDLAEYLQWQSQPEALRSMLLGAEFIDEMGGWDWIHDWDQHADDTLRKQLEYHQESFANGANPRRWQSNPSRAGSREVPQNQGKVHENPEKVRESKNATCPQVFPQVHEKQQKVPQKGSFSELGKKLPTSDDGSELWLKTTEVPQKPEIVHEKGEFLVPSHGRAGPEPEPEPEPEAAANESSESLRLPLPHTEGHPEFEAYRQALCSFMGPGTPPPGDVMVSKIIWASRGATVEALVGKFREFAKTRREPPKSYGFWPEVIAEWFNTPRKSRSG